MSDAIITVILTQLTTILEQQIRKQVRLVSGVEKEIKKLSSTFKSIKAVLVDAEKRQVKEETIKLWLEKLKDVSYDTEDVLSEWISAMRKAEMEQALDEKNQSSPTKKVRSFINLPCVGFNKVVLRRDIALKIKDVNERLDVIASEKDRYKFNEVTGSESSPVGLKTTSYVDMSEIQGREVDKNTLMKNLFCHRIENEKLNIVSIIGMGGIGKTTLAQVVYNSSEVIHHFERRIWVCVSDHFDEVRIAKAIVEDIEGTAPYLFELETLLRRIRSYIAGQKYLLVLDDVWNEDYRKWEQILNSLSIGAAGSTILVTARNERAAKVMGSSFELRLGQLSGKDSWALFSRIAFCERSKRDCEEVESIGRRIAEKCKGLPLSLKTIAGLMRFKSSMRDWESVLSSEFWEIEETKGLFPPLMLSYYDLPPKMKQCFSFCAFFPKDHVIEASNLIRLWMGQGYLSPNENVAMEAIGEECLQNLAMRSFFQDVKKDKIGKTILSVKMHDIVHDFAQYLTKNECSVMEMNGDFERKAESSSLKGTRHLTLIRAEDTHFPTSLPNVEKLRTFWVQSFYDSPPIISQLDKIEPELLRRMACVRAIDVSRNRIGELSNDIGKLSNLKYLNLSHNPFWELPSTLCDLYNLQTLKLSGCDHLRILPCEIDKLTNLRHLELERTDSLRTMPKGIGKLSSLQTLSKFIILPGKGQQDTSCRVEDLRNLNNLRGFMKVEGLGYIENADEAKQAELQKKKCLSGLHMDFSPSVQTLAQEEVIEALTPHESLSFLHISSYVGTKFPSWIVKLPNLQKLFLQDCQNCTSLPPLGKLPSLVTLHIEGISNVKCIGLDFLGMNMNHDDIMNGSAVLVSGENAAFPKLKKLKISKMASWEEWILISKNREIPNFKIMPSLRCLKISNCGKLKELPSLLLHDTPITKLRIRKCPFLKQQYHNNSGEKSSQILHILSSRIS